MEHLVRTGDGRVLAENREGQLHLRKERPDAWTATDKATFLDHLAATCNVAASATAAGRRPQSAQALRRRDPEFADAWDRAVETGYATLEAMLLARAQMVSGAPPAAADTDIDAGDGAATVALSAHDMTTKDAIGLLDRYRKTVKGIRQGDRPGTGGRAATAKETYMALLDRMRVLKLRLDDDQ